MTASVSPRLRYAALFAGGVMAAYVLLALLFAGRAGWYPAASDAFLLAANLLAAASLAAAAWQSREGERRIFLGWALLAGGQALYVLGDTTLVTLQARLGELPFPSLADVFYLLYYLVFATGLLILPTGPLSREERLKTALDMGVVTLSTALLLLNFLVAPMFADESLSPLQIAISIAYPAFDLLLFFVLLRMMYRLQSEPPLELLLLQAGVGVGILSDVGYAWLSLAGAYASGSLVDLGFACSYLLVGLAGAAHVANGAGREVTPRAQEGGLEPEASTRRSWVHYLPYAWAFMAYLVLALRQGGQPSFVIALYVLVGVIVGMLAVRQIIAQRENDLLYLNEQRRRHLAETLSHASREVSGTLDFQAAPGLILDQLAIVVPFERCSIMLEEAQKLVIVAQRGFPDDGARVPEVLIPIREDVDPYLHLVRTRQPVIIDDVTQAPGWTILPWLPLNRAWLGVPLVVHDRVIGMFSITRREAGAFTEHDARQAIAFASQAAVALDNAQLYEQLNQAYRTLETLDRAKTSFIEVVAHELRTPLTVIKGYAQTMSSQASVKSDPQNSAMLDGILRGTERMHEVVNNMLDLIRIESRVLELNKKPVALAELFQSIGENFKKALHERKIKLSFQHLKSAPVLQADSDLLYKVFFQLVMNAIKYTPDGGQISVTAAYDPDAQQVLVVVADTGIGIDREQLDLVFEKFYQTGQVALHSSGQTKFKGGGPGLGLPLARGIVMAHGGSIWAESEGHDEARLPGSKFYVRLPV